MLASVSTILSRENINIARLTLGRLGSSPRALTVVATDSPVSESILKEISSISGVKHVYGKAYDGYGFIMVEFQFGKDLMEATQDLRDAISTKRADLPTEMKEPIIQKFNDTDRPIVSLALSSSTLSQAELTRLADPTITRELRSIPGVAEAEKYIAHWTQWKRPDGSEESVQIVGFDVDSPLGRPWNLVQGRVEACLGPIGTECEDPPVAAGKHFSGTRGKWETLSGTTTGEVRELLIVAYVPPGAAVSYVDYYVDNVVVTSP